MEIRLECSGFKRLFKFVRLLELEPPKGEPRTFVLAGAGTGGDVFRNLQRQGVPFVTGNENGLDYPTAKALAAHTISEAPYNHIGEEKFNEAKQWIERCNNIICFRVSFSDWESANPELYHSLPDSSHKLSVSFIRRQLGIISLNFVCALK